MKKKLFIPVILLLIVTMVYGLCPEAEACTLYLDYPGCYHLIYGVGDWGNSNQYYWVSSSASSYLTTIESAFDGWIYTTARLGYGTPISIARTTSQYDSRFDIYLREAFNESEHILAVTYHVYDSAGTSYSYTNPTSNWRWAQIILNSPNFENLGAANGNTGNDNRIGVVAHELGHAMGLAHCYEALGTGINYHPERIMCQLAHGRYVCLPTLGDLYIINHLY